jgi:hypothetical protein
MSTFAGPNNSNNGLILELDPANPKSYNYNENIVYTTSWYNYNITETPAIAPDGTNTATQWKENAATNVSYGKNYGFNISANSMYLPYTASIYVKANTRTFFSLALKEYVNYRQAGYAQFDVANNIVTTAFNQSGSVINNASITPVGNGWSRCVLTTTLNAAQTTIGIETYIIANTALAYTPYAGTYTSDGTGSLYVWGPQIQQSANVTTFTTSAPKTNTINDLSTTRNNGTIINNPVFTNSVITFSGNTAFGTGNTVGNTVNSYIAMTNNMPNPMRALTAEIWIKPDARAGNTSNYLFGQQGSVWRLMQFSNFYFGFVASTANNSWYSTGTAINGTFQPVTNSWHQVVAVYNGSQVLLYVNGQLDVAGPQVLSGNLVTTYSSLNIGLTDAPNLDNFSGQVGPVKLYNRALSAEEILKNFNSYRGRYGL